MLKPTVVKNIILVTIEPDLCDNTVNKFSDFLERIIIMSSENIVKELMDALEKGDFETASSKMADNFSFLGPLPIPIGKNEFIMFMQTIRMGIPDWSYQYKFISEEGEKVTGTVKLQGTHSGELNIPMLPALKPSGIRVELPDGPINFITEGEKVKQISLSNSDGGGILGLLKQLGIQLPEM